MRKTHSRSFTCHTTIYSRSRPTPCCTNSRAIPEKQMTSSRGLVFFKLQFVVKLPIRSTDWALPSDNPLKWWLIWQRLWQGRMHHRLSKSKFVKRRDLNGQFVRNMLFNCSETKATPVFVCKGMWSVAPKASNHVGKEGEIPLRSCLSKSA